MASILLLFIFDKTFEALTNWLVIEDLQLWCDLCNALIVGELTRDGVVLEVDLSEPVHASQVAKLVYGVHVVALEVKDLEISNETHIEHLLNHVVSYV